MARPAAGRGRLCVLAWIVLALASCAVLPGVLARTHGIPPDLPGSPSAQAHAVLARDLPQFGEEQLVLAFDSATLGSDDEAYQQVLTAAARAVRAAPGGAHVLPVPDSPGRDPRHAYLLLGAPGDAAERQRLLPAWQAAAEHAAESASNGQVRVALTGLTPVFDEIRRADLRDLRGAEAVSVPAALLVLVVGLGSVGAALVPLLFAGLGVLVGIGALAALDPLLPVDGATLTVATTVGFGLGLDYALLMLLRYRAHREQGLAPAAASARTRATAGRAVLWCAAAVVVTSAGLTTVPIPLVRSIGVAAAATTVITAAVALTALPAALPRLDRLLHLGRVRRRPAQVQQAATAAGTPAVDAADGLVARCAEHLMRRPWPYLLAAVGLLVLAALPAGGLRLGLKVDRTAIADTAAGVGLSRLEQDGMADITMIVLPHPVGAGPVDTLALTDALKADPRVSSAGALDNGRNLTVVAVADRIPVDSPDSPRLTADLRALAAHSLPADQPVLLGGPAATLGDFHRALDRALWRVAAIAVAGTLLLMLVAFRSLLLPLKALAMNALSTAAAHGLLAWSTRHTDSTVNLATPLLALTIVFGLSLDYEVFMVHRITAHYRARGDCRRAVALGLSETALPITLAAATMATVFAGLLATHRQDHRQLGFLVAAAVLLDATLIRLVVVPTLMRLLGHLNWWLPPVGRRRPARQPAFAGSLPNQLPTATAQLLKTAGGPTDDTPGAPDDRHPSRPSHPSHPSHPHRAARRGSPRPRRRGRRAPPGRRAGTRRDTAPQLPRRHQRGRPGRLLPAADLPGPHHPTHRHARPVRLHLPRRIPAGPGQRHPDPPGHRPGRLQRRHPDHRHRHHHLVRRRRRRDRHLQPPARRLRRRLQPGRRPPRRNRHRRPARRSPRVGKRDPHRRRRPVRRRGNLHPERLRHHPLPALGSAGPVPSSSRPSGSVRYTMLAVTPTRSRTGPADVSSSSRCGASSSPATRASASSVAMEPRCRACLSRIRCCLLGVTSSSGGGQLRAGACAVRKVRTSGRAPSLSSR
ncbi:MMPL family transporter [Kitasatospora sp. NPDC059795]|uniref:MMPL family transporter n=1 Tax=Kitasatospora sp. NPDC059795 TaxID=3346949 RepID=UPI003667F448